MFFLRGKIINRKRVSCLNTWGGTLYSRFGKVKGGGALTLLKCLCSDDRVSMLLYGC